MNTTNNSRCELLRRWVELRDQDAATRIHERYVGQRLAITRKNLSKEPAQRVNPNDVVQSVFRSFFQCADRDHFHFAGDASLWKLLLTVTLNKGRTMVRQQKAGCRDFQRDEFTSPDALDSISSTSVGTAPGPLEQAVIQDPIEQSKSRLDRRGQQYLEYRKEGLSHSDIGLTMHRSDRQVRRIALVVEQRGREMAS